MCTSTRTAIGLLASLMVCTAASADPCSPDDLAATMFRRLGFGPHHEIPAASGRPIPVLREGKILALG